MHFLYPVFLLALLCLAIPLFIHLFNFRKYQKVYFSNVQFLKEIQEQQASRKNLKERLILAARLLALLFLVLAFAKPYVPGQNAASAAKQQSVSIFVDNSYSMQTLNREGALLDQAKERAKEIASAYDLGDNFQLLTQDFEGKHQRFLTRAEFNDAVDAVKISPQSRTLQPIVDRQQSLLDLDKNAGKSVYIISDFQKNMAGSQPIKAHPGLPIHLIQLKASSLANVAIDSVILLSAIHRPGESEKLIVRLHNYADEKAEKVPLKLMINHVQKAQGSYTINARSVQYDTLTFSGLQAGWQRGEISLQDNPVTFDNQFYFTFNVVLNMPLLLIDGGTPNPYLNAVFAADRFFEPKRVPYGNVDYATLNRYPLVILSDISSISTGLAQQLKSYVVKGGTLLVFPSADADFATYRSFLQSVNTAYPDKLVTDQTKVTAINLESPVFNNIFESIPQNPDLPVVTKYFRLSASSSQKTEDLLSLPARISFFAGYASGKGKVYLSAVALNESFSNLPRHALFVPLMFRIALLSGHDQPPFYTLGRDQTLEIPAVQTNEKQLLKLVKDGKSIIPDTKQQEGSTLLYVADQLNINGIYDLKKQDSTLALLAFNDNRSESDLSYLNSTVLHQLVPQATSLTEAVKSSLKSTIRERNFGLQLWKLCIILALVFLGAEVALIRFYKPAGSAISQPV